jgi:DOMON domain
MRPTDLEYQDEEVQRAIATPRSLPLEKRKGLLGCGPIVDGLVALIVVAAIVIGAVVGSGAFDSDSSSEKTSGVVNENADNPDLVPTPAVVQPTTCSFDIDPGLNLLDNGSLTMKNYINLADQTVSVQLNYDAEAWLGFAFTELAQMVPNTAIIGLPDENTIQKYFLQNRTLAGVNNPLQASLQTLIDASVRQENERTIMEFTKKLVEGGEVAVKTDEPNRFNWAIGSSNTLSIHQNRGSVLVKFNTCQGKDAPPVAPPVKDDQDGPSYSPSYAPSYVPTYYEQETDAPSHAPIEYIEGTDAPSYTPTYSPTYKATKPPVAITYAPTYKPTHRPVAPTYKPTVKPTNAPTIYYSQDGSWSKRGNRRSCSISVCPSDPGTGGPWANNGAKCDNGLDTSYWNETAPVTYEYFTNLPLQATSWPNVWKVEDPGQELPLGWGGDFASGQDCFDDPLRGGYRIDLTGTEYWFTNRAWVQVKGYSPSLKMVADGTVVGEWRQYQADGEYTMYYPAGAKVVEVYCGGWPASCHSELYVTKPATSVPPPVSSPGGY